MSARAGGRQPRYMTNTPNMTARAARWSAAHWKTATALWLAFVAAAVVLGGMAGSKQLDDVESSTGETARAEAILADAGFRTPASEAVLVQSRTGDVAHEARGVAERLRVQPQVTHVRRTQTSRDGRSTLVEFDVRGAADTASDRIEPVLDAVAGLQRAAPAALTVAEFGQASVDHQVGDRVDRDLARAEKLSLPITFAILVLAFGAF